MKHRRALSAAATLCALSPFFLTPATHAQGDKPKPEAKEKAPEKTPAQEGGHVAKAAPFEIELELDGVFTAAKEHQVSLTPKAWSDMTVLSVLPHGARVKKGDRLVTLDTEKLAKAIADAEAAEPAARVALQVAENELAALEKSTPRQLEAARRSMRISDEEMAHYEKIGYEEALKAARRSIQWAQRNYDYAKEELQQLEKMYAADDLTEETEEIILKRARNDFERATESLRLARMDAERQVKVHIPRERIEKRFANENSSLAYDHAIRSLPKALEQKRLTVAKARSDRAEAAKKLRDMRTDLAAFDLRAPADGIVYYGRSKDGNWITAPIVAKKLVPGGKLSPREVFMTVAETSPLGLSAAVPEEKLANLRPGLKGTATPVSQPSLQIPVGVRSVNYVPGAFRASLSAATDNARLYPGMKAKVKLSAAKYEKVITVPNALLDGRALWIQGADGKKVQREVKPGPSDGKVTVILGGLKEGEKVVAK